MGGSGRRDVEQLGELGAGLGPTRRPPAAESTTAGGAAVGVVITTAVSAGVTIALAIGGLNDGDSFGRYRHIGLLGRGLGQTDTGGRRLQRRPPPFW